jgi:hypothetical protein
MANKTRVDKAVNGLNKIVQRGNKQEQFIFADDKLTIGNSSSQLGGILLLLLLLLLPIGAIVFFLMLHDQSPIIPLLVLEGILVHIFYKALRGNTVLTINFREKYIQADNLDTRLEKIFPTKTIPFSEIKKVALKEKRVSTSIKWIQLSISDTDDSLIVLTNFSTIYPESLIADKVKFLIDVIIWTEKQDKAVSNELQQNNIQTK